MVYKRISSRKTQTGYSVMVFVRDGKHVKPIISLLNDYFQAVYKQENPQSTEQILLEAEKEISALEQAKVLR
ncbi:unnamed protein product [marine sediment metagenome]|uniref:Uncharacterized protein n=1 Tax=marine sediment metagenome TaxID=412755 RepID=X0ZTG1_9ZZZZ